MNHAGAAIPRRRLQEKSREHPVWALGRMASLGGEA